jgi:hypothetical protein
MSAEKHSLGNEHEVVGDGADDNMRGACALRKTLWPES